MKTNLVIALSLTATALSLCAQTPARRVGLTSPAEAPLAAGAKFVDLNIVAHADDDGFFMNPDIFNAILNKHTVVTVYLTGGNVQVDDYYYMYQREHGSMHEYAGMAQAAASMNAQGIVPGFGSGANPRTIDAVFNAVNPDFVHWNISIKAYGGVRLTQADCVEYPNIHLIFMRFPAAATIAGSPINTSVVDNPVARPLATLQTLYTGASATQSAEDNLTVYSKVSLTSTLAAIMEKWVPTVIRCQDYVDAVTFTDQSSIYWDHEDHYYGAFFTRDAVQTYTQAVPTATPQLWFYRGYGIYIDNATLLASYFAEIKYWVLYYYSFYDYQMEPGIYANGQYSYTNSNTGMLEHGGFSVWQQNENHWTTGFTANEENHQAPQQITPVP